MSPPQIPLIRSALLAAVCLLAAFPAASADLRVVAYVVGWETPPAIDPTKLTHINFAFGKIEGGKVVLPHPGVAGNLAHLRSLKAKNPRLKVLLSVGGWEAEGFSDAALSATSRTAFAESIVALLREHSLDGVDHVYLDFINVMTYDFFNSLTPTTGHHAGLYASPYAAPTDRNAQRSIKQHLAAGIPPDKLVLGVAFYGRGFAGVKPEHHGLNLPYERFEAAHPYAELVEKFIGRNGFVREWDERAQAPFLWNAPTRAFITYDDPQSIRIKARYVRQHQLGGVMFWELSQDANGELLDAIVTGLRR